VHRYALLRERQEVTNFEGKYFTVRLLGDREGLYHVAPPIPEKTALIQGGKRA